MRPWRSNVGLFGLGVAAFIGKGQEVIVVEVIPLRLQSRELVEAEPLPLLLSQDVAVAVAELREDERIHVPEIGQVNYVFLNVPIPVSFCLFSSLTLDTNQYKLIKA